MPEIIAQISNFDSATGALIGSLGMYGPWAIFVSTLFFGETAIFIALMLSQQGVLDIKDVFIFATLGTLCADIFWFLVGRFFPQRIVPKTMSRLVFAPVHSFFESITRDKIFLSIIFLKFFVGVRLAIILYLARLDMSFMRFLVYDTFGTLIYMVLLSLIGIGFGHIIQQTVPSYHVLVSVITAIFLIFFLSHVARHFYTRWSSK